MKNRKLKSIRIIVAASLLTMALTATPARADHEQGNGNIIAPIATIVALGLLLNHNRHSHRPRYEHYGHYGSYQSQFHGHNHKRKHKKYKSRRHSYSQGGYQRPHKRHYQH